jgi:hypothetical protein
MDCRARKERKMLILPIGVLQRARNITLKVVNYDIARMDDS